MNGVDLLVYGILGACWWLWDGHRKEQIRQLMWERTYFERRFIGDSPAESLRQTQRTMRKVMERER